MNLNQLLKREFEGPESFESEFGLLLLKANRKEKSKRTKLDALASLGFHSEYDFRKEYELENAEEVNEELKNQGWEKCEGCNSWEESVGLHDEYNLKLCDECNEIVE